MILLEFFSSLSASWEFKLLAQIQVHILRSMYFLLSFSFLEESIEVLAFQNEHRLQSILIHYQIWVWAWQFYLKEGAHFQQEM